MSSYTVNLGHFIYDGLEFNRYLNEIHDDIIYNYSIKLLGYNQDIQKAIPIEDALRFVDLLANSYGSNSSDLHKAIAQEMVALLHDLFPYDKRVTSAALDTLERIGNYQGMRQLPQVEIKKSSLDSFVDKLSKRSLLIPTTEDMYFFKDQKYIFESLSNACFSYSGPTSMGKSFIVRYYIKQQILNGSDKNYVIVVPSIALINEVFYKITNDFEKILAEHNYGVVTSSGAVAYKKKKNFIFVLTAERLLFLLIGNPEIKLDFVFFDEAHELSKEDSRSIFYFKVISMLERLPALPTMVFASPNIPNPEIYLKVLTNAKYGDKMAFPSFYAPVSQIKYFINFEKKQVFAYNESTETDVLLPELPYNSQQSFIRELSEKSQTIVYCTSPEKAIIEALDFASNCSLNQCKELEELSHELRSGIHEEYNLAALVVKGIAYHVGHLPTYFRRRIEELFSRGIIKVVFCTSTLLEGVNLPADNLIVTKIPKKTIMRPVDFKNLLGRVGRLQYNLYGKVFFILGKNKTSEERYKKMICAPLENEKLFFSMKLTMQLKTQIVQSLKDNDISLSNVEVASGDKETIRKIAMTLLNDIVFGRSSYIRSLFAISDEDISEIRKNFAPQYVDDDITVSSDQAQRLEAAIRAGLKYPRVNDEFDTKYNFFKRIASVFLWNIYEPDLIRVPERDGSSDTLFVHFIYLLEWMQGMSTSRIIQKRIEYKANNKEKSQSYNRKTKEKEQFDCKNPEHINREIIDVLFELEHVVRFKILNYLHRFSSTYKRINGVDVVPNDWYEFTEYGTCNYFVMDMQKAGYSREVAVLIFREYPEALLKNENKENVLNATVLLASDYISVKNETKLVYINTPEFFVSEE